MPEEPQDPKTESASGKNYGMCLALGAAGGVALGGVTGDMGVWIPVGIAVGLAIGVGVDYAGKKNQ